MDGRKIFVIGYNKTATVTFHKLFRNNGLQSYHGMNWNPETHDCFSDNGPQQNWKQLHHQYPNSMFILNSRSLKKWVVSRANHCYDSLVDWGCPTTPGKYVKWIEARQKYYKEVVQYFQIFPKQLLIVDIDQPGWEQWVCEKLELECNFILQLKISNALTGKYLFSIYQDQIHQNKNEKDIPHTYTDRVLWVFKQACKILDIPEDEQHNPLLLQSQFEDAERLFHFRNLISLFQRNFS